jgi:hypothetical protein
VRGTRAPGRRRHALLPDALGRNRWRAPTRFI